jgi:hypothetical protein
MHVVGRAMSLPQRVPEAAMWSCRRGRHTSGTAQGARDMAWGRPVQQAQNRDLRTEYGGASNTRWGPARIWLRSPVRRRLAFGRVAPVQPSVRVVSKRDWPPVRAASGWPLEPPAARRATAFGRPSLVLECATRTRLPSLGMSPGRGGLVCPRICLAPKLINARPSFAPGCVPALR